jgi:hypothetical protein
MTHNFEPKTLTILDPRTFDGDPFTVAQRAAEQSKALVERTADQVVLSAVMHRNSFMETILQDGGELLPMSWDDSAYARKWKEVDAHLQKAASLLETLGRAAGFDPKHPPKAE